MNKKFFYNTGWIISGQVIQMILQFIVGTISARYLGPNNYGIINYVSSFVVFASSFCTLGLNGIIINELIINRNNEEVVISTCIVLRLLFSVISQVAVIGLIMNLDADDTTILIVTVIESVQIPFSAFNTINFWFQSKLESKYSVIIQEISCVLVSVFKVYLLINNKNIYWFAAAFSLDAIIMGILYLACYQRKKGGGKKWNISFKYAKYILKLCVPFTLANVMSQIYQQTDKIMIKQLLGSNELVGMYTATLSICTIIGFIPIAILDSSRPTIMMLKDNFDEKYNLRIRQLFAVLIWTGIIYSIVVTLLAKFIILILYGNDYLGATGSLRICVWYTAFCYLGSGMNIWLICEKQTKYSLIFTCMGAITNICLNSLFIPKMGILGASIATLITQCATNFIFPSFYKKTREYFYLCIEGLFLRNIELKKYVKFLISILKQNRVYK